MNELSVPETEAALPLVAPGNGPPHSFRSRESKAAVIRQVIPTGVSDAREGLDDDVFGLFGSRPWVHALANTYGFPIARSTLASQGTTSAAILFAEIDDIRGRRVVSLPFSDYLDPLANDRGEWNSIIAPLLALDAPLRLRCLHNKIPIADDRFISRTAGLWHSVALNRSLEELWDGLEGSAHRNIRKAERSGVVVREGHSIDDLRTFYSMHSGIRKAKYGLFAQPFSFFENLHAGFAADNRLIVVTATVDERPIAGIVFLISGDTLYYKFNASADTSYRPNDLLVWCGMKVGRSLGLSRMDFGISDVEQPGLIRFKRKFATDESPITELTWAPPGHVDARAAEAGELLRHLTAALTAPDVPDGVTRRVGDEVYRYFC